MKRKNSDKPIVIVGGDPGNRTVIITGKPGERPVILAANPIVIES